MRTRSRRALRVAFSSARAGDLGSLAVTITQANPGTQPHRRNTCGQPGRWWSPSP
jgi:hypothetical protein